MNYNEKHIHEKYIFNCTVYRRSTPLRRKVWIPPPKRTGFSTPGFLLYIPNCGYSFHSNNWMVIHYRIALFLTVAALPPHMCLPMLWMTRVRVVVSTWSSFLSPSHLCLPMLLMTRVRVLVSTWSSFLSSSHLCLPMLWMTRVRALASTWSSLPLHTVMVVFTSPCSSACNKHFVKRIIFMEGS